MGRFVSALTAAFAISGVIAVAQSATPQKPTETITAEKQTAAKNLIQTITTVGCIRLWKPATGDPTKMPPDRQPGIAGVYLLTPVSSTPETEKDLPTYLLTPSATHSFSQYVGRKVEITGTAQPAPMPSTVQDIAAPPPRPEEKPSTEGMPRLTVSTLKMVTENCP
jgi:hypothetical protein